jgi:hypothetical protein
MLYMISWFAVLSLIALWSLGAWGLHALSTWGAANADGLIGATMPDGLPLPALLEPWISPELVQALTALLAGLKPALETALSLLPALAGGLSFLVWGLWGLGCLLLLILGLGLHSLIAMLSRRASASKT